MCVVIISTAFVRYILSDTFLIVTTIQRDTTVNLQRSSYQVPVILVRA